MLHVDAPKKGTVINSVGDDFFIVQEESCVFPLSCDGCDVLHVGGGGIGWYGGVVGWSGGWVHLYICLVSHHSSPTVTETPHAETTTLLLLLLLLLVEVLEWHAIMMSCVQGLPVLQCNALYSTEQSSTALH